ncbi:MAG: molybdopterin-binding protein [Defluviitaleaceae bacterium]|nr:molybdopterin-binding protein [Defluviitaleaceae bacterium]
MKKIATKDAVGHVLCHDITRIIKDVEKDAAFRKGHIVCKEDIEVLHSMGKFNLYVWEKPHDMLHENEAADILRAICEDTNMSSTPVKEGKITITSQAFGLFCVDVKKLETINSIGEICISTRHTNTPVHEGEKLAGVRVVPLVIKQEKMDQVKKIAGEMPILKILPYKPLKAGIITTGSEIAMGLIEDNFAPVIEKKLNYFGISVISCKIVDDVKENIANAILQFRSEGAEMILCTGGMSVDPDDATPGAIAASGAKVVSYGAPVLPGNMFLLAYFEDNIPVLGLPGCVMYERRTIFDIVLPRIAAGVELNAQDIAVMGNGGLCPECKDCRYPNCAFGKGT